MNTLIKRVNDCACEGEKEKDKEAAHIEITHDKHI